MSCALTGSLSIQPGESTTGSGKQVRASWEGFLPGFDPTHHQLGNMQVVMTSATEARVVCYGTAAYSIKGANGGEVWTVTGSMNIFKVAHASKMKTKFQFINRIQTKREFKPGVIGMPDALFYKTPVSSR